MPTSIADAQGNTVEISLGLNGGGTNVTLGETFTIDLLAQEIGSSETVFSAFADISFDTGALQVQSISYPSSFPYLQQGDTNTSGVVNEVGAVSNVFTASTGTSTVAQITFKAIATGVTTLTPDEAEDTLSESTIFGNDFDQRGSITYSPINITVDPNLIVDASTDTATASVCTDMVANNCTLRAAVIESNTNPGVDFTNEISLPVGTYNFSLAGANEDVAATGDLDITQNLTIVGADRDTTIIDGQDLDRLFHLPAGGVTLTLKNLTIQNGSSSFGGGILSFGPLVLENVVVTGNASSANGGGVASATSLTLTDSFITSNQAAGGSGTQTNGAGLFLAGSANITNTQFQGNIAQSTNADSGGGAIYNLGTLNLTDSTFFQNGAFISGTGNGFGGGIYNIAGNVTLDNTQITFNISSSGGGAIASVSSGSTQGVVNVTNGSQLGETGPDPVNRSGYANFAADGAAIYSVGVTGAPAVVTVTDSTIQFNQATNYGGGIVSYLGDVDITNSTIDDNIAVIGGGVIAYGPTTTVDITGTAITNNSASVIGGGIFNGPGSALVGSNLTIDSNSATNNGGGIWNGLKNDTLASANTDLSQ